MHFFRGCLQYEIWLDAGGIGLLGNGAFAPESWVPLGEATLPHFFRFAWIRGPVPKR